MVDFPGVTVEQADALIALGRALVTHLEDIALSTRKLAERFDGH